MHMDLKDLLRTIKKNPPLLSAIIFIILYVGGLIAQVLERSASKWGGTTLSFNPIVSIFKLFFSASGFKVLLFILAFLIVAVIFLKLSGENEEYQDERNFSRSKKGVYGTSGWMSDEEMKKIVDILSISKTTGKILGINKDGKIVSLPMSSRLNKHTAIYGASGTGKSRSFSRPEIFQCVARGESIIVTDPKGELANDTIKFLERNGYDVKIFNLVNPEYSDSWACLDEITADPSKVELMAQTFADVVIKNTAGLKSDHFWDNAEMNLFKAVCLLVATNESLPHSVRNIGTVYEYISQKKEKDLDALFKMLPADHPAQQPWAIFKQSGEGIRGNIITGLASRIQVFQAKTIRKITSFPEIDLEAPAKHKCAYFVIMSDQESTLDFLSSLFFSFLFIRTVKYADTYGVGGKCDVPINFILDEFPNIGAIPDFTKKLSTIRSRDLRVAVIFQNIAQLQNRYPNGLWEEIIGNCDTQIFLGCTDQMTAKFVSERSGEMTVDVVAEQLIKKSITLNQDIPSYKENQSVGKRFVLTPDEVMRLPSDECLIILRGQKIMKLKKFDFSKHPTAAELEEVPIRDHVPEWRKENSDNFEFLNTKKEEISPKEAIKTFNESKDNNHFKNKEKSHIQSKKTINDDEMIILSQKEKPINNSLGGFSDNIDDF